MHILPRREDVPTEAVPIVHAARTVMKSHAFGFQVSG